MTEIIEGTAVEVVPEVRAVAVVQQPGQAIVAAPADPAAMVATATRLADVLADIVERKHLYAQIGAKRYPTVEAWMTIARLDNVVARESQPAIRHEDGSWEAFAELVRLSDGMVIGSSSALCGDPQDKPWNTRADYQRRAMAQTRATSRAFRQHYSWVMALAGYEPTPAEEMPRDKDEPEREDGGLVGTVEVTSKAMSDFTLKAPGENGLRSIGFKLRAGRNAFLVEARGPLAEQLDALTQKVIEGRRATVWGSVEERSFPKGDSVVTYEVLVTDRMRLAEIGDLPAVTAQPEPTSELTEAESEAIWDHLQEVAGA